MKVAVQLIASLTLVVVGVVGLSGCKQGPGERCQVTADCEDGLNCNQATNLCQGNEGGMFDAAVPILIDAPLDGPPDAVPDAP